MICTGCNDTGEVCVGKDKIKITPSAWEIRYRMEKCRVCKRRQLRTSADVLADAGIEF